MSTESVNASQPRKAIIIGGSLGGLFTGNVLRLIGWDAVIYERSPHDLDSRGGGIVLQPEVVTLFSRVGASINDDLGVLSRDRIVYYPNGNILSRSYAPQSQTSWSLIYTTMRDRFGGEHYHQGKTLVDLKQQAKKATAFFADGTTDAGDLLIGADGGQSTVRRIVEPGNQPHYAGYIAWRGLVEEKHVPDEAKELLGHFAFANTKGSHMLGYLVPGDHNSTKQGQRYYNWVWYRVANEKTELPDIMTDINDKAHGFSIPPGQLTEKWLQHINSEADALLPLPFKAMVHATPDPFVQAILDLTSRQMVYGRRILLGDAAFIPRPHTAASTAKAAANALVLADELMKNTEAMDIDKALHRWEMSQIQLGNHLYYQGTQTGNYLLFNTD